VKDYIATVVALLAASGAPASPRPAPRAANVGPVVEAERAFARAAQTDGVNAAFLYYSAPDALVFQPDPTLAKAALAAHPIPAIPLKWWPAYAGIAGSGDLGFTTGPYVAGAGEGQGHGWYFTIWRRQPDGSWRWVLDHGPRTSEAAPDGTGAEVAALPAGRPASTASALSDVKSIEARLAAALAADARAALPGFLAADGRLMRVGPQPAVGASAWAPLLAAGPDRIETAPLGGGASAAGDLAYTYGSARWRRGEAEVEGHYVRIWQHRRDGWKLIVDNLIAVPPRAPAGNGSAKPAADATKRAASSALSR
jgi:ketosteroid isomerase-like protein